MVRFAARTGHWEITNIGYARVNVGGKRMLVASNFLDNPNNLPKTRTNWTIISTILSGAIDCIIAGYGTGQQRSKEQRLVTTGKKWPWNVIEPRPIIQCDTNGRLVAKYPYPAEAGRRTGLLAHRERLQQAALFKRPISTKRRYLTTMLAAIFGIGKRTILLLKRTLNFTEGLACDIMEVLDFFYIKSWNKRTKKEGTRRFFALYPGDDERSESAP